MKLNIIIGGTTAALTLTGPAFGQPVRLTRLDIGGNDLSDNIPAIGELKLEYDMGSTHIISVTRINSNEIDIEARPVGDCFRENLVLRYNGIVRLIQAPRTTQISWEVVEA